MERIIIISGKGSSGKTTLAENKVITDCDVNAPNPPPAPAPADETRSPGNAQIHLAKIAPCFWRVYHQIHGRIGSWCDKEDRRACE